MSATSSPGARFTGEIALQAEGLDGEIPPGIGPWRLAGRRLRRNKVALFFGGVFLLILVMCLLAPVYAHSVAHAGLADQFLDKPVKIGHKSEYVLSATGIPIGPTSHSHFFLGAD